MKTLFLTLTCSAALAAGAAAQNSSSQQNPASGQQNSSSQGRAVTMTGCVYQTSDQPEVFALERMAGTGQSNASNNQTGSSQTASNQPSTTPGAVGTSGSAHRTGWFRLSGNEAQQLSQYVGKSVQVTGTVMSQRDENGAEIIVHDVQPGQVKVTTIDLRPAPELKIQSITPGQGSCTAGSSR